WGQLSPAERGRLLMRVALRLADHEEELTRLEARDTGKPMRQARADARAIARYFEFYAGAADKLHGQTIPYPADTTVLTVR
ncbi:aldehyde dehydrogenase family protein, partial [Chromohalobacter sp. HP20-39]